MKLSEKVIALSYDTDVLPKTKQTRIIKNSIERLLQSVLKFEKAQQNWKIQPQNQTADESPFVYENTSQKSKGKKMSKNMKNKWIN